MQDNRCPNCENDISETVTSTLVAMLQAGDSGSRTLLCPHCGEALSVTARVTTTLLREPTVS